MMSMMLSPMLSTMVSMVVSPPKNVKIKLVCPSPQVKVTIKLVQIGNVLVWNKLNLLKGQTTNKKQHRLNFGSFGDRYEL